MSNIPHCAVVTGENDLPVMVVSGEAGFIPFAKGLEPDQATVDKFNEGQGVDTEEKVRAMKLGSMFGWNSPAVVEVFA